MAASQFIFSGARFAQEAVIAAAICVTDLVRNSASPHHFAFYCISKCSSDIPTLFFSGSLAQRLMSAEFPLCDRTVIFINLHQEKSKRLYHTDANYSLDQTWLINVNIASTLKGKMSAKELQPRRI